VIAARKTSLLLVFALLGIVGVGALWFVQQRTDSTPTDITPDNPSSSAVNRVDEETGESPFAIVDNSESSAEPTQATRTQASDDTLASSMPAIDITALGLTAMSDAELLKLVERLKRNPRLLQQLIDEFRQEGDALRLQRLSDILAQVGGDQVALLASELVFSGDDASRKLGLSLLGQLQPESEQAREIISSMLATEIQPDILNSTLSALARPGDVDQGTRGYLADQVAFLTTHEDPSVRGISLDILTRWDSSDTHVPVILAGLEDTSQSVRTSAGYALARYSGSDPEVVRRLFSVAENRNEHRRVRRAALLALKSQQLSERQHAQIKAIERALNTK